TAMAPARDEKEAMLRYAVIGVGINVNHAVFPAELAALATSLQMESGSGVSREALLAALLRSLDEEIVSLVRGYRGEPGVAGLLERFAGASSWVLGRQVSVDEAGGYTGVTAGLDERGFLLVNGDDGVMHTVLSGGVRER
ncbi:MAG TPA: biotin--[acetyl-CoA-carboxylase] ligase, partial [Edaphobacter sp.]|nr:biotin--[acetyl-CoA-carboxylase] ligase [Edaphobacter sp.]